MGWEAHVPFLGGGQCVAGFKVAVLLGAHHLTSRAVQVLELPGHLPRTPSTSFKLAQPHILRTFAHRQDTHQWESLERRISDSDISTEDQREDPEGERRCFAEGE